MNEREQIVKKLKESGVTDLLIEENGQILTSFPEYPRRILMHSISKSIFAIGLYFPVSEGLICLEEKIGDCFEDEIKNSDIPQRQREALKKVEVRHLLSMTMGQKENFLTGFQRPYIKTGDWVAQCLRTPIIYEPGTHFLYSDACMYLAGKLVQKRSGENLVKYLQPRLFDPMGVALPTWELDPDGDTVACGGLLFTIGEVHKFGRLCLDHGKHDHHEIVSEDWIKLITSAQYGNNYGYGFWTAEDNYYMFGYGGKYCVVNPQKELVATAAADNIENQEYILELLMRISPVPTGS